MGEPGSLEKTSAALRRCDWPGAEVSPGSKSVASAQGFVQEPGRPHCLHGIYAGWATGEQGSRLTAADAGHRESERQASTAVPPSEGNEARREGRWGVGAPW